MDFRDLIVKLYDEKQSTTEVETPVEVKESNLPSLKKIFETLSEAIPPGLKPLAVMDPQNKSAGAGVVTSSNPSVQKMLSNLDPKDVKIVMTTTSGSNANTGTMAQQKQSGVATGVATAMKEEIVSEKAPPGMEDVVLSLKKKFPGEEGRAYAIAWSMYNKKHGKKDESALEEAEKWIQKAIKKPGALKKQLGVPADEPIPAGKLAAAAKKGGKLGQRARLAQTLKKMHEGDIASTKSQDTMGAGLGAGRSSVALESIQVNESMNKKHRAAYQEGQADGLRERACRVKHYEDMEEAKHYYEGWKAGLDECYGMGVKNEPITGMEEMAIASSMPSMPAMEAGLGEMDKTAYMKQQAIKTPGPTFKAFGQTMHDKDVLETNSIAFESLDKQLAELLKEDSEPVAEGLSVSMSTGNQGAPDSVSVTGTDDEAGKLLAFIKQVGLGGMGAEKAAEPAVVTTVSDYGAPKGDNPDMKALLQKVGVGDEDYKDEEGHDHKHGEPCNECGMMEADCGCDEKEKVMGEVQTQDQKLYATTSESDNSEDDGFDASARNTELDNVGKPASGGATNEDGAEAPGSNPVGQEEQEEAEEVNEESTEKMDQDAEKAAEKVKKDIEYDDKKDREHDKLDEWANNAGQKGTDTAFEQDIEFMTKVISGGLNKPKVTGQTTVPVIASQDARNGEKEDLNSWIKLAGVKPAVKK
jgi:hypothetical protein